MSLHKVNIKIGPIVPGPDINRCLLEQYNKQVSGFEMELLDVSCSIATIDDAKELLYEKFWIFDAICYGGTFHTC